MDYIMVTPLVRKTCFIDYKNDDRLFIMLDIRLSITASPTLEHSIGELTSTAYTLQSRP